MGEKIQKEKIIVSILAAIFAIIVVILGNFLVTYISSDLSFGQNCLLRIPFYGTLLLTSRFIGMLFRKGNKKDIAKEKNQKKGYKMNKIGEVKIDRGIPTLYVDGRPFQAFAG